ncbi:MAG: SDR family NAD(P)-dependent oxidoreductase [Planctomycetaceae bacterium]
MNHLFDLTGRTALITGGSKGLGKAMALGFAAHGANLMICSRNADELKATATEIREATGQQVEFTVADLTRRDDVAALVKATGNQVGAIDILVNNAGSNLPQLIDSVEDEAWDEIVQLNLSSCMALTRAFVPQMKRKGWGRVIHISSIIALAAAPARSVYAATKAGLIGMARAQALELGDAGITVNCIAPGPFLTDLPAAKLTAEQRQLIGQRTALKRWGQPVELVGPALLLASQAGSYMSGTVVVVDGGIVANVA